MCDFFNGAKPAHYFEFCEGDSHFWFVVGVFVDKGSFFMELLGSYLAGVGLDGEGSGCLRGGRGLRGLRPSPFDLDFD